MKVRMKSIMAGPAINAAPGQEINVEDEHGAALIKGGYAEDVLLPDDVAVPLLTASPAAIARAEELDMDINTIKGSGKGGSITVKDVAAAAKARDDEPDKGRETGELLPPENAARPAAKPRK